MLSHIILVQLSQFELRCTLIPIGYFRDVVTSVVKHAHGIFQLSMLTFIRQQFDLKCCLHIDVSITKTT